MEFRPFSHPYFRAASLAIVAGTVSLVLAAAGVWSAEPARDGNPAPVLRGRAYVPKPMPQLMDRWIEDYFDHDEVWRFEDRATYDAFVDSQSVDEGMKSELKGLYRDSIDTHAEARAMGHFDMTTPGGFVVIPKKIRAKLPKPLVEAAVWYQYDVMDVTLDNIIVMRDWKELQAYFQKHGFSTEARGRILKDTLRSGGEFLILFNPENWRHFPRSAREEIVSQQFIEGRASRSVEARIQIRQGDDLAAIARKYAGERDPRPIERYLRKTLGSSPSVDIPLEKILHPFIRKWLDAYSHCHGPNCFNTGLNVNRGAHSVIEHTPQHALMREAYENYRFVRPAEGLQVGDLLIYRDPQGLVDHVSTYVGDGLVFTKNGLARESPYVFQEMADNERIYFPEGEFRLSVMRKPGPGEAPVGAKIYPLEPPVIYRAEPKRAPASRPKSATPSSLEDVCLQELMKMFAQRPKNH